MNNKPPFKYHYRNVVTSSLEPNVVHSSNTLVFQFFVKYFLQRAISVFEFELPKTWARNYFEYVLFGYGYLAVFNTDRYGVIPQECTLSDNVTVFRQPRYALVSNPVFRKSYQLSIGEQCEIIKLQPDYSSILDIVTTYADLMTMAIETAGINLFNSKLSTVFFAENKTTAESYKLLYDKIASGEPMVVADKKLLKENGEPSWVMFEQNVGQNYITSDILNDMDTINNQFNSFIGIPNANTTKRERLVSDEVNKGDIETGSLALVWLDTMRHDIERVNELFNLNLSVKYKYEKALTELRSEALVED